MANTQGTIGPVTLPSLIHDLCRSKTTGTLMVADEPIRKTLYFDAGKVVFAASTDPDERLGELFLRRGMVGLDVLREAAAESVSKGKRLGTVLVERKAIRPQDLIWGVSEQVKSMVISLFQWTRGTWKLNAGPLPSQEVITLKVFTPDLLLTGIKSIESWSRIEAAVGGPGTRYATTPQLEELAGALNLSLDEWTLLSRCEAEATLSQICSESAMGDFESCRLIWAFTVVGLLERRRAAAAMSAG
ncbi:MAG TPA: DUF4388 domain-containing protein [Candidatus Polarisedimenticolia bacterium]|nr:DUF4388 domain-containing protein [Candidatus Polarisedimenticolia bacterium]